MTFSLHLTPWLYVNQDTDFTDDGNPNEDGFDQCGPASVKQAIYNLVGDDLSTDTIKDEILGQGVSGVTYTNQLVDYLNGNPPEGKTYSNPYYLGAKVIVPKITNPINASGSLLFWEWKYLVNGYPSIGLFWWDHVNNYDSQGNPILHWRCINGMDNSYVYSPDTLYETGSVPDGAGYLRSETYTKHQSMFYWKYPQLITVGYV